MHAGMPLGYFVPSMGRTGPELRVARGTHELLATDPAARIGTLLPNGLPRHRIPGPTHLGQFGARSDNTKYGIVKRPH